MVRLVALLALPSLVSAALLGHRRHHHRDHVEVVLQQQETKVEMSTCDCSCCAVEQARDSGDSLDATRTTVEIECDVSPELSLKTPSGGAPGTDLRFVAERRQAEEARCGMQQCLAPLGDHILEVAEGQAGDTLDYARFCKVECQPLKPEMGSGCRRKPNNHKSALKKAFVHFNAVKKGAVNLAAAKKKKGHKDEEATEKLVQGATAIGAEAEGLERQADALIETEASQERKSNEIVSKNAELVQAAAGWSAKAKKAAMASNEAEQEIAQLEKDVEVAASQAASDVVAETVKDVSKKILKKVHGESIEKAKKIKAKMLKEAPEAGKKAAAVYTDALGRAAATAGQYTKAGDAMGSASANFQVQAGMLLNEANNWQRLGDINKAQKSMQQAHQLMSTAIGLGKKADGAYGQAKSIMGTLGDYANQAAAASYHAEYLLNPDVPPPPLPLV